MNYSNIVLKLMDTTLRKAYLTPQQTVWLCMVDEYPICTPMKLSTHTGKPPGFFCHKHSTFYDLVNKGLITRELIQRASGGHPTPHFKLTELGEKLLEKAYQNHE